MKYHVYAVWDFMSLLKTLQNNLTCTQVPWFPVGDAETRHLINEIVAGEESDIDSNGAYKSHFELYRDAMLQCGANLKDIDLFIEKLRSGIPMQTCFENVHTPEAAIDFVNFTFNIIDSKKLHLQSAIFTFGREDLIPGMFISLINDLNKKFPETISVFKYYLERHIEVDGDHHSKIAIQMTENLCSENPTLWEEATAVSIASLQKRIALWDAVYNELLQSKSLSKHALHSEEMGNG
jgi:hypothetical protein